MGKAIIVTNPRPSKPNSMGVAIITATDQSDTYQQSAPGATVAFSGQVGFPGDVVTCNITSQSSCELTNRIGESIWAQGRVTRINFPDSGGIIHSEFQVETLCDPNPFGINFNDMLQFQDPNSIARVGDTVAGLTTSKLICDWESIKVVQPA